ncbi:hypothetical protein SM11_pD0510 (plasmid) [Sinorhizobium meliloti SM11]|uniref:Uncharacterized protein n=2 Tax=Rhizobium meliloti TaxID=382 RepID=Q92UN5_RHIME|nr:hypothetical protein SM11_pD0510 [Sinorhizobium meliloti SM11]AGG72096.1 Hypothetical protein SM2011_b20963 [Sinorhizobium meliloti 2011]CAC49488.1 hypothetical protein SM_b20963 [Sinorhizobium meliloti 1021]
MRVVRQWTSSIDLQTKHHGDPGKGDEKANLPLAAIFPFLRRHDPDQVQGSGSTPSQHRLVLPSECAIYAAVAERCQRARAKACKTYLLGQPAKIYPQIGKL